MSYEQAQAKYDALMPPDDEDNDIEQMDRDMLEEALRLHDCDDLSGRAYYRCVDRARKIADRILDLDQTP